MYEIVENCIIYNFGLYIPLKLSPVFYLFRFSFNTVLHFSECLIMRWQQSTRWRCSAIRLRWMVWLSKRQKIELVCSIRKIRFLNILIRRRKRRDRLLWWWRVQCYWWNCSCPDNTQRKGTFSSIALKLVQTKFCNEDILTFRTNSYRSYEVKL